MRVWDHPATRRAFLRDVGISTTAAALGAYAPAGATAGRRGRRGPTVAVFGGGIAGLTAAHELAERGFAVTVYERRAFGGKARSTEVPGSASGGRRPLPGEHGYRVEFGFYQNLPDTMRRIPFPGNRHGVFDNLVGVPGLMWSREGRRDLLVPLGAIPHPRADTPQQVIDTLVGLLLETELPPQAVAHLARRMTVFMSSSDARRIGQWDTMTWSQFLETDRYSDDYRKLFGETFSQVVQASKTETTSAKFSAWVVELLLYNVLGRGANGPLMRALDRPTNEAWFDPWIALLRDLGVRLRNRHELSGFDLRDGRIGGARVRTPRGSRTVVADWYVCALPVERARRMWSAAVLAADPHLERMRRLDTAWMNGVQFYLRENAPLSQSYVDYVDSAWTLSSINQAQLWSCDFASTYGDGRVRDCLSAISSNWKRPGVLFGKPASECSPDEIAREFWHQIKCHVNDSGEARLTDDMLVSWSIDPGIISRGGRLVSDDPLVLPTAGARPDRPDVGTAIPNLMLAGDYLKSDWEVANMEAANFNARRAVNELLDRAGSRAPRCSAIPSYRPPEWEPLKRIDAERYRRRQPNLFDGATTDDDSRRLLAAGNAATITDSLVRYR